MTVPIALAGMEAAHVIANGLCGSPQGSGELFASAGSGSGLVRATVAVALALVLVGLAGRWTLPTRGRAVGLPFACVPPVAFVALELIEGIFGRGSVPWGELVEPTFVVGLALVLPFAGAGYLIARLLLRAGDAVRRVIARRRGRTRRRAARAVLAWRRTNDRPRPTPQRSGHRVRGPPGAVAAG